MAFHAHFLTNLLQVLSLLLRFVHADTATTATTYAQPLPCFGFCLALDPGMIRRDDGAPYLTKIGGTYIMYYTLSHINTRNSTIGYATSTTLEYGSWTDHGSTGITTQDKAPASNYNAIDPTLVKVGQQYFMSFGSFWNDLQIIPMNAAGTAPANYPANVQQIEWEPSGNHATEASFIYQYTIPGTNTPYFYLFWSEGIANGYDTNKPASGTEYKVRVCSKWYKLIAAFGVLYHVQHHEQSSDVHSDHEQGSTFYYTIGSGSNVNNNHDY
ncbi:hypothetical protein N0V82_001674 [Gnomoniopsis sp. IMI 355080]|nr:hypothetical protein N0V82_001674 [Gnomoniopsis sp. IMI 355080]